MSDTPLTDERTLYTPELSAIPPKQSERLRSELEAKMEDGYSPRLPNPHDD